MFEFWFDLPPLLRAIFSLAIIGVAVVLYFVTNPHRIFYGIGIVGIILLFASGAGSNKGGYKF